MQGSDKQAKPLVGRRSLGRTCFQRTTCKPPRVWLAQAHHGLTRPCPTLHAVSLAAERSMDYCARLPGVPQERLLFRLGAFFGFANDIARSEPLAPPLDGLLSLCWQILRPIEKPQAGDFAEVPETQQANGQTFVLQIVYQCCSGPRAKIFRRITPKHPVQLLGIGPVVSLQ